VNWTTIVQGENFRCLFGGEIETLPLSWDDDGVWCDTPPNNGSWLNSNRANTIQVLNDRRDYYDVSNALPFLLLLDPLPEVSFIAPTSGDRNCHSTQTCGVVYVYGHHFTGGSNITCVFFGSHISVGSYAGQKRINRVLYDRIACPIAAYDTVPMTGPIYQASGFQVLINRSTSGPSASNSVGWTYTCAPCDS